VIRVRLVASFCIAFSFSYLKAQTPATASSADDANKPRVYVTDSDSWETKGAVGGNSSGFGGASEGGARPQTAEVIKTFGERCPQVVINQRADMSQYVVRLEHEGGKGYLRKDNKVAVFVRQSGDSIFSKSTMSLGGSVQDACAAITAHWASHSSELKQVATGYGSGGYGEGGFGGVQAPQATPVTVSASVPNCDIEVDGNFVGNTSSTINLTPGKHEITVKKAGYQDWVRNMMVASGAIHLNAEMLTKQ
jgi:hypothetical protein